MCGSKRTELQLTRLKFTERLETNFSRTSGASERWLVIIDEVNTVPCDVRERAIQILKDRL